MGYITENELDHFDFSDAQIADVEVLTDALHLCVDNVLIKPECSANRDIRLMRTNGMVVRFSPMEVKSVIKEGYRTYNADGVLMNEDPDVELGAKAIGDVILNMPEGYLVSMEKSGDEYTICFDGTDEATYDIVISCNSDKEEWERFLNL